MVQPFRASAAARGIDPDPVNSVPEREVPAFSAFTGSVIVLGTGVVFSFGGLAFRLTDDITAWQYVIFRGIGAFAITGPILAWRYRGRLGDLTGSIAPSHLAAGGLLAIMSSLFIISLERASVAFVLGLQTLAPLAAAYFSWLLLRERVSKAVVVATLVSLVGVLTMFSATLTDRVAPSGLLAIALPVIFGLYATLIRQATRIDAQVPILIGGAMLALLGTLGTALTAGFDVSLHDALIGLFAGGVLLALPGAALNHANRVVPAPDVALLLMSEVVLAPLWVWLFVDERPEATTIIGGAIIFAAVFGLLLWRQRRARALARPTSHAVT